MIVLIPMHNTYVPHLFVNPCSAIGSYKKKERMYSMKKKKKKDKVGVNEVFESN